MTKDNLPYPASGQLYDEFAKHISGLSLQELAEQKKCLTPDHIKYYTGLMADYAHAQRIVSTNEEGRSIPRNANDPDPSRILGSAAAFMTLCGHHDVAAKFMDNVAKIVVEPQRQQAGFVR